MAELQRKPAVYFENRKDLELLKEFLTAKGYVRDYEDAWMFFWGGKVDKKRFHQVKEVKDESDLQVFIKIFDECYCIDDPQNPYGEVKSWLAIVEDAWHKHCKTGDLHYFIAYKGERPVAVAVLKSYQGIGYISDVGSLKSVRGEGFGKLVTLYCVHASQKNGNSLHCLATEEGTYPNEFYKRIGFKTEFTAVCYTKTI